MSNQQNLQTIRELNPKRLAGSLTPEEALELLRASAAVVEESDKIGGDAGKIDVNALLDDIGLVRYEGLPTRISPLRADPAAFEKKFGDHLTTYVEEHKAAAEIVGTIGKSLPVLLTLV